MKKPVQFVENNTDNLTVTIMINNRVDKALADTGSSVNLITESKANQLEIDFLETDQTEIKAISLVGLNGSSCKNIGIAKVPIKVKDTSIKTRLYVIKDDVISVPIILGLDFLKIPQVVLKIEKGVANIAIEQSDDQRSELKINPAVSSDNKEQVTKLVSDLIAHVPKHPSTNNISPDFR